MPYSRPTVNPRWTVTDAGSGPIVDNDVVNPTSGESNVSTPPSANQDLGWDFNEYPPRQWDNWFKRQVSKWIPWLDQQEQNHESRIALNDAVRNAYTVATLRVRSEMFSSMLLNSADAINGLHLSVVSNTEVGINQGSCGLFDPAFSGLIYFLAFDSSGVLAPSQLLPPSHPATAIDTWYHIFVCMNPLDPLDNAIYADTSIIGATILADFSTLTVRRRIGSVLTDGSGNLIPFTQRGDRFYWDTPPIDISSVSIPAGVTFTAYSLSTPLDVEVRAHVYLKCVPSAVNQELRYKDGNFNPAVSDSQREIYSRGSATQPVGLDVDFRTNISKEILLQSGGASLWTVDGYTNSWVDPRGRIGQ